MAQFHEKPFAANLELHRPDIARAGSPGNHFPSLSVVDLEIVIEKPSWIDWNTFPPFANTLDYEIGEFDFLTRPVFYMGPVRSLLFRGGMSAADRTEKS